MRVSSYNIYTEINKYPDYFVLVHGYTGAIDIVTRDIAIELKKHSKEDNIPSDFDIDTKDLLTNRGYITDKSKEQEHKLLKELSHYVHKSKKKKQPKQNSFLFAVTENCNFRCPYCYENGVSDYGNKWKKAVFTKELVDKAFNAIEIIQPDRKKIKDSIGLYGGEPLMKENYEIVKYIIEQGKDRGYSFRATTNCYDLDHFSELLGPENIDYLHVSIDGNKETNNKRRIHFENKDTFTKIMSNFSLALEKEVQIQNRINLDSSNFHEVEDLMKFYREKGFLDNKKFRTYLARVIDHDKEYTSNTNEISCIDFYKQGKDLKKKNPEDNLFRVSDANLKLSINKIAKGQELFTPKISYCGAQSGMFILGPTGDIYTCWEKIGIKSHSVGSFSDDLKINDKAMDAWHERTVGKTDQCSKCKYAFWCGGGCAGMMKPSEDINLNRSNCMDFPKLFNQVLNEYFEEELKDLIETQV